MLVVYVGGSHKHLGVNDTYFNVAPNNFITISNAVPWITPI